jgi:hypothetical protein
MPLAQLTPAAAQELRAIVDGSLASSAAAAPAAAAHAAAAAAPAAGPQNFCTIWPGVKPILDGLSAIVIFIPGYGAAAAAALKALVAVGQQIFEQTCPHT